MSQKDLKSKKNKPILAILYEQATREVFGVQTRVVKKHFPRFIKAAAELRKQDILLGDYATRLLDGIKWWVNGKKFKHVPMNVFLGKWAQGYYLKHIGNRHYEKIDPTTESTQILIQQHLTFLHAFVAFNGNMDDVFPLMGESWNSMPEKMYVAVEREAFVLYSALHGVKVSTYKELEQYYV